MQLREIVASALEGQDQLNEESRKTKSDAIKEFIATCDNSIKAEYKEMMNAEEAYSQQQADKLLDNL